MIAKRDIKGGEIILRERPFVMGPKIMSQAICLGCHKIIDQLQGEFYQCTKCSWPMCGKDCETSTSHIDECLLMHEKHFKCSIKNTRNAKVEASYCVIVPLRVILLKKTNLKA